MKIHYVGVREVGHILPTGERALIGVCDKDFGTCNNACKEWKHSIRLEFDDIDATKYSHIDECVDITGQPYRLFNKEHALKIINFIKELPSDMTDIVVHCHAGISRSAAIAKFLGEYYGVKAYEGELWNRHVYKILRETYEEMK